MWLIANKTPFVADYAWVRDKDANKIWMVAVKATFHIGRDGRCCLAARREPVRQTADPYGEFGQSSLRYEADLFGLKATTDVLVVGDAIAPNGRTVPLLDVSLRCATVHKTLRVAGDRVWVKTTFGGLQATPPRPFLRMPLVYERAFGGWDRSASDPAQHRMEERNPVGTGFAIRMEHCEALPLPNVEYAEQAIASWSDRPVPAGFNAIDCAWSPRRELAGTYDERWLRERFPLWASDFNPRYNNCAPADQQTAQFLVGGERVDVTNMSEDGIVSFTIPTIGLAFRTRFGAQRVDHTAQLCTVIVEPNIRRLTLVWQTSLVCNRREDRLDETLVTEDPDGATGQYGLS
jgi:hypothetical protein